MAAAFSLEQFLTLPPTTAHKNTHIFWEGPGLGSLVQLFEVLGTYIHFSSDYLCNILSTISRYQPMIKELKGPLGLLLDFH